MTTKYDIDCPWIYIDVDGYSTDKSSYKRDNRRGSRRNSRYRGGRKSDNFREDNGNVENLKKQALDAAKEVKRWGEQVKLRPMNSHDRRIVHMTLKEDKEIKTDSRSVEGNDRLKSVVVSLREN